MVAGSGANWPAKLFDALMIGEQYGQGVTA
jgi:hypothetical protein